MSYAPFVKVVEQNLHLRFANTWQSNRFLIDLALRVFLSLGKKKHGLEDRRFADEVMSVYFPKLSFHL